MAIPLPPDPYKALGVEATATEGDIRKVYLKLVLKCHPDKIQDPALRAQKTDEFHRIQEAWDLLSDKVKREDYDEKVKLNARSDAMRGSSGQARQMRSAGYAQAAPAGYNTYEFKETVNANIYTAEPRQSGSRRRDSSPPLRAYTQPSTRTHSYEDELRTRYDNEPRTRKSASTEHSGRKPAGATMERERRRDGDRERERERYEKERKKKEYSSSQKSRDKEKRSRTEEKTSRKAFIVNDSPEEYESRRSPMKDRGESLMDDFERMRISTNGYETDPKALNAMQYISASRSKATRGGGVPIVPPAPQAVRHEEFRPRPAQRSDTFSTYTMPQPSRPYFPEEEEVIHRSSARPTSRRPSADAASRSSDPNSPHIVTAEPPFARKPPLQHHNSAPPQFADRQPIRSQTLNDSPRRSAGHSSVPSMPARAQTFHAGYSGSSPLKKSHPAYYSEDSPSSESDDGHHGRSSRPAPMKRPSVKHYKLESRDGKTFTTVVEEDQPVFARNSSSSPRRSSFDRPSASRTSSSSVRPKFSSSSSSRYHDERSERPSVSVRREVPGNPKSGSGGYFGEVSYGKPYEDIQYANYGAAMPKYAYYTVGMKGETVS